MRRIKCLTYYVEIKNIYFKKKLLSFVNKFHRDHIWKKQSLRIIKLIRRFYFTKGN